MTKSADNVIHIIKTRSAEQESTADMNGCISGKRACASSYRTFQVSTGGVGKSTLTIDIGYHLAELGSRVLRIDMDSQASLTVFMGLSRQFRADSLRRVDERGPSASSQGSSQYGFSAF